MCVNTHTHTYKHTYIPTQVHILTRCAATEVSEATVCMSVITQTHTYIPTQVHILTRRAATEVSEAIERSADRARERDAAILELQQLKEKYAETNARLLGMERESEDLRSARRDAEQEARDADARAKQAQDMAQRENERLQLNLTSASGQLSVLMETIETLQTGGGAEQAAANLSARMSACMSEISQLQLSNSQLHHWLEDRTWQCGQLDAQITSLRDKTSALTERLSASKSQNEVLSREVHALKATLSAKDQELQKALRTQDRSTKHTADMETELAAYRKALDDERTRHANELKEHDATAACEVEKMRHLFSTNVHVHVDSVPAQRHTLEEAVTRAVASFPVGEGVCDVESRLREIMAECASQVDACTRAKSVIEWELKQKSHRVRVLASALDVSISAQRLAEQQLAAFRQRLDVDSVRVQSTGWARAAANEHKIGLLSDQLESTIKRSIDVDAQCARLMQVSDCVYVCVCVYDAEND
jgi:hypothetical protein